MRLALKLATGAGKTTVMAMIIAWQTINAVRRPGSKQFTRGFLVVTPGLTIKDRLRVLQPNDPDSYYASRELVPGDMLDDVNRAKIVITNYHAFKLRERIELSKGGRALLQGRGEELNTLETEGQMIQRVMPDLMGLKNILVLNDEAHHCYREKPGDEDDEDLKGDEKKEAEKNNEAARLWISGLEAVNRKLGLARVIDLSATPFFLTRLRLCRGHAVPLDDERFLAHGRHRVRHRQTPARPRRRQHPRRQRCPSSATCGNTSAENAEERARQGRHRSIRSACRRIADGARSTLRALREDLRSLGAKPGFEFRPASSSSATTHPPPSWFTTTSPASTGRTKTARRRWKTAASRCSATSTSTATRSLGRTRCSSTASSSKPAKRWTTTSALWRPTRSTASAARSSSAPATAEQAENITDQDLLREVMNTVGKHGRLGEPIRCVVSVSMLTEGWDANTVTHVLGVRAFGTQLLCEQVIGRALRRQSYDLNEEGLFNVEYADVFGIPFDFTAKPVIAPPQPPRETIQVKAVRPERDALEITLPARRRATASNCPKSGLTAEFNDDSVLELTPDLVGPSITQNSGIIGEGVDLDLEHIRRHAALHAVLSASPSACSTRSGAIPAKSQSSTCSASSSASRSSGSTTTSSARAEPIPAQLMYQELADMACERITAAITRGIRRQAPDQGACSTPTTPSARPARQLQHLQDRSLGDRRPPLPHQLGHSR